jgi:hypothetical protein
MDSSPEAIIKKPTLKEAAEASKKSLGKGPRVLQAQLQDRLNQTFQILGTLGFIDTKTVGDLKVTGIGDLEQKIGGLSKEIATRTLKSMEPIYKYYEKTYGTAYRQIQTFMKERFKGKGETSIPKSFPLNSILVVLNKTNEIRQEIEKKTISEEGIVKLTDLSEQVILDVINVQDKFKNYMMSKASKYTNSEIKTEDSYSSKLYELLTSSEKVILQIVSPIVTYPKGPSIPPFFKNSSKQIYLAVQKESKDIKQLTDLKPVVYERPENNRADIEALNMKLRKTTTFRSTIQFTPLQFVQSITDRSIAIMAILYFKLLLENIVVSKGSSSPKSILKNPLPVTDATAGTGETGTTATATSKPE